MTILNYLPTLIVIFIAALSLIFLLRLILIFLINRSYQRYLQLKKATQKITPWKKDSIKEDEELLRKKEIPRAHSAVKAEIRERAGQAQGAGYELMPSQEKEQNDQVEIVDIVKPIGFFTAMILGQKLSYLIQSAQVLNKRGNKGFWVSMIEAKDRSAGRQHGRG